MCAFAAATSALFADPNLSVSAVFTPDGGAAIPLRVIARRPDRILAFGDTRLHGTAAMFDLRVGDVAEPRPGDRLEVGGGSYIIQGEPVRDAERLIWTVSAVLL